MAEWRSSTLSLRNHFAVGPRLLSTVSAIAGVAFALRRAGRTSGGCLGGLAGLRQGGGSTISGLRQGGGPCGQLSAYTSWHGDDERVGSGEIRPGMASGLRGGISRSELALVMLLASFALSLPTPRPRTPTELVKDIGQLEVVNAINAEWAANGEAVDGTRPQVKVEGNEVRVGEEWNIREGVLKQGATPPIAVSFGGKNYKIFLSTDTETVLRAEGLLSEVLGVLSEPPRKETVEGQEMWVWGHKDEESLLLYYGGMVASAAGVEYRVYLPKGAFGVDGVDDLVGRDEDQAFVDLRNEVLAVLTVAESRSSPPAGAFREEVQQTRRSPPHDSL